MNTASPAFGATAFTGAIFETTHNSYSGDLAGQRGSIVYQLDHGIRFIEPDIHDDDYASVGDYEIGHGSPGDQVDHSGQTRPRTCCATGRRGWRPGRTPTRRTRRWSSCSTSKTT